MHTIIRTIALCTLVTAVVVALPAKSPEFLANSKELVQNTDYAGKFAATNAHRNQVSSAIQLQHLSTLYVRDFFADLIRATLGMSVKELLVEMETTFEELGEVTNDGLDKLQDVSQIASPEIQKELAIITENAIGEVIEMIDEFLLDLGSVLPSLTSKYSTHDSASDIIYALLGKTLEELVTAIANALCRSLQLLNNTIASFMELATKAKPEVGAALVKIADEYLNQGKSIIIPILDQLRQLVEPNCGPATRTKFSEPQHDDDLLNGIISKMLRINIKEAAVEADNVLSQLIPLFETTRSNLSDALEQSNGSNEVRVKVMSIYDKAMNDVLRDTKPILNALLHFKEDSRREKTFVYDLVANLLGIGLKPFKSYVKNATSHVERIVKIASTKIVTSSVEAGFSPLLKVLSILNTNTKSAQSIIKPLSELLNSIVEHEEKTIHAKTFNVPLEDEWSESDGNSYNRDFIIDAASQVLGFEVLNATKILKSSLENLDELTATGLEELQSILPHTDPILRKDIFEIMNETLTTIHITLQPLLDVLLPFLPDQVRPNKQVALDIYVASNEVNLHQFLNYCKLVSKKIPEISELATIRIKIRASRAGPKVHGKIRSLLRTTDANTRAIIQPFLDIIGPVISPR